MIGIVSGIKAYLVLGCVLAVVGALTYLTHTLTSGAAAKARLDTFAEASAETQRSLERTKASFVISQQEVAAARDELDLAKAEATKRMLDRAAQGEVRANLQRQLPMARITPRIIARIIGHVFWGCLIALAIAGCASPKIAVRTVVEQCPTMAPAVSCPSEMPTKAGKVQGDWEDEVGHCPEAVSSSASDLGARSRLLRRIEFLLPFNFLPHVCWRFRQHPQVPHIGFVHQVGIGREYLDRRLVAAPALSLEALKIVPCNAVLPAVTSQLCAAYG